MNGCDGGRGPAQENREGGEEAGHPAWRQGGAAEAEGVLSVSTAVLRPAGQHRSWVCGGPQRESSSEGMGMEAEVQWVALGNLCATAGWGPEPRGKGVLERLACVGSFTHQTSLEPALLQALCQALGCYSGQDRQLSPLPSAPPGACSSMTSPYATLDIPYVSSSGGLLEPGWSNHTMGHQMMCLSIYSFGRCL